MRNVQPVGHIRPVKSFGPAKTTAGETENAINLAAFFIAAIILYGP